MLETDIRNNIEEFLKQLARSIQLTRMYVEDHQLIQDAINGLHQTLNTLLSKKSEVTIGIIGNELAYEKEPLYDFSQKRQGFIKHLKSIGIKKITFVAGVEKKELISLSQILGTKPESLDQNNTIEKLFASKGLRHIALGEIGVVDDAKTYRIDKTRFEELMRHNYQNSIKFLTKTFKELKGNQSLNLESAKQIVEGLINNILKNKNLLLMLTSMKGHNETVFEHGVNVAIFTLVQAEMLGIEQKYLVDVGVAAMLHDIGTLSMPIDENIDVNPLLQNPFDPNLTEKKVQKDIKGAKILLETEGIGVLPAIVAFEHNIHYDMSGGGPKKLYGKQLNLISMMISISDYYDKLRKHPSYYQEKGPENAYNEMVKLSGKHFHPDLLQNFFSVIGVYPPGTLVELDSNEIAMVIQSSMLDIHRPQVEILYDNTGKKLEEPQIVNLVEKDRRGQFKRSIIKSISPLDKRMNQQKTKTQ